MTSRTIKSTVLLLLFLLAASSADRAAQTSAADAGGGGVFGAPDQLQIEMFAEASFFKIDKPYYVTILLRNTTSKPIICNETFDFVAGIRFTSPPAGYVQKTREVSKPARPIVIAPGAYVGKRMNLAYYFPAMRKPGKYEVFWSDPVIGESRKVRVEIVEYVLLVTRYGNISMRLLPGVAPETVKEFKRRVNRKFYDGGFLGWILPDTRAQGARIVFQSRTMPRPLSGYDKDRAGNPLIAGCVAAMPEGPGFFIQAAEVPETQAAKYRVFAVVFDGMEAVYAMSDIRCIRDLQGNPTYRPAGEVCIERAVMVDAPPEFPSRERAGDADKKPTITFLTRPRGRVFSYGAKLEIQLNLVNDTGEPVELPENLSLTAGLRVVKTDIIHEKKPGPGGSETTEKKITSTPLKPVPQAPEHPLPLVSRTMQPGDVAGIIVEISELYGEFSEGGHFKMHWESGALKSIALPMDIRKTMFARISTNKGDINVILFEQEAPQNVARFIELARKGFYDGKKFHHVVAETVFSIVQTGSPTGDGPGRLEKTLPLETKTMRRMAPGSVVMARTSDPDSASSQFFIVRDISDKQAEALRGKYTIIGQVVSRAEKTGRAPRDAAAGQPKVTAALRKIEKNDTVMTIVISKIPPFRD